MSSLFHVPMSCSKLVPQALGPWAILLSFCCLSGCGHESAQSRLEKAVPDREIVTPVSGTVLIDGDPVVDLTVRLVKEDAKAPAQTDPKALTDAEGKFRFTTYMDGDGVPAGNYKVLVEQLNRIGTSGWAGPDKLNNLYNHLTEPATTIEVVEGSPVEALDLDLAVSGKPAKPEPPYTRPISGKPVKGKR